MENRVVYWKSLDKHALYKDLVEGHLIRLISLKPGGRDDPILITLSIVDLDHAPEYDALSYVWGNPTDLVSVECNGHGLSITRNLDAALRRIRHTLDSCILWVDAICIKQTSLEERSHHVGFMDRVYRRAKRVLVHLGDDKHGPADVVALIQQHQKRAAEYQSLAQMPQLTTDDPVMNDRKWVSLAKLSRLPWFTRAWVLQEVGVARTPVVLYGEHEFEYRALAQLLRWILRCAPGLQSRYEMQLWTIHTDWEAWTDDWRSNSGDERYTLLDFLQQARSLKCSVLHDHLYAFQGHPLARRSAGSEPFVRPNYKLPIENVYEETSQYLLQTLKVPLDALSAVEHDDETIADALPSWMIRWHFELTYCSLGYWPGAYYKATPTDTNERIYMIEGKGLQLQGNVFDTVAEAFPISITFDEDVQKPDQLKKKIHESEERKADALDKIWTAYMGRQDACNIGKAVDHFSLTLVAGLTNYERAEDDTPRHRRNFKAYWRLRGYDVDALVDEIEEELAEHTGDPDKFWTDMSLGCAGRSFFMTEKGRIGVGPWVTKRGDLCTLLHGARVPFILRARSANSYRLVGESYIHGIMLGEIYTRKQGTSIILE